jgi:hypothetical protein
MLTARHWHYCNVLFAGRDTFATIVVRAADERSARAIVAESPAVQAGMLRARLFPFLPLLLGTRPEDTPRAATQRRPSGRRGRRAR